MHITGCEYIFHICRIFSCLCLYICAFIHFYTKCFCYIILTSKESSCDQNKICIYGILASFYRNHHFPSGLLICLTLKFDKNCLTEISFLVFYEFFHCRCVNARIRTKHSDCFLLAIICLADSWPLRPWVQRCPLVRCFRHHLQLENALCSMTDRCSDTVISCISASDYNYIFSFCRNVASCFKLHVICP